MLLRQNPNLIVRQEEDGKYLVYNRDNQTPLILNYTSYSILRLCDGSRTVDEIRQVLLRDFDIASARIGEDRLTSIVDDHIELLRKLKILVN